MYNVWAMIKAPSVDITVCACLNADCVKPYLHEYSCWVPPTMVNCHVGRYYKEITCQVHQCSVISYHYFHKQTEKTLIRQLLQELPNLCLLCLQKR